MFSAKLILVLAGLLSICYIRLNITSEFPKQLVWHIHVPLIDLKFMVDILFCAHLSVTAFRSISTSFDEENLKQLAAQTTVTY